MYTRLRFLWGDAAVFSHSHPSMAGPNETSSLARYIVKNASGEMDRFVDCCVHAPSFDDRTYSCSCERAFCEELEQLQSELPLPTTQPPLSSPPRPLTAASTPSSRCAIDMLAGPSEVLVIADSTANVETVAADLLAQVKFLLRNHFRMLKFHKECLHSGRAPKHTWRESVDIFPKVRVFCGGIHMAIRFVLSLSRSSRGR